ncbi:hypothetical protein [Corynebacterium nuruki]|uniref:hypothetical protein n=1 Tax=Corynebacterium nuruki TaxID=1032851 RepID=UPI0039BF944A
MSKTQKTASSPLDDRAREVADRLHRQNRRQLPGSLVIGTEHEAGKVEAAERTLAEAGVGEYAEYLDRVRSSGDFLSVTVPGQGGTEISMKL